MLELLKTSVVTKSDQLIAGLPSCFGLTVTSPTMVWITPMLPFRSPPKALPNRAIQKLFENPTRSNESKVPKQPRRRTGLRPILSDKPPQYLQHCQFRGQSKQYLANLHAGQSLREREGSDENTCIEGSITAVADLEVEYELPSIGKDGSQSDRFTDSYES